MDIQSSKTLDAKVSEVSAFVAQEAEAARKGNKMQLIVMAVVGLILVIYFAVINKYVRQWTEPKDLATYTVRLMDDNVPTLANMLETTLTDAVPQLANFITNRALKDGIPFLVKSTEKYLNDYTNSMATETSKVMNEGFQKVLIENKAQFITILQNNQNANDPEYAVRPLRDALRDSFVRSTTNRKTEAGKAVERSLVMLRNMAGRIKALASKDPKEMSRKEHMASRLLKMHWLWMRQRTAGDIGSDPAADL